MSNGHDDDVNRETQVRSIKPRSGAESSSDRAEPTRILPRKEAPPPPRDLGLPSGGGDLDRTVVHGFARKDPPKAPPAPSAQPAAPAPEQRAAPEERAAPSSTTNVQRPPETQNLVEQYGPIVGWLVVVGGPGRGNAVPFFAGMNAVGRAPGQRVVLGFGDDQISRDGHFFVTFEPKKRSFHVNHGGKGNLFYLNTEAVLGVMPLKSGDMIEVGDTKLMFIPLCGPDFTWET
jgi:hypothetical protein